MEPLISVIVPVYNGQDYIMDCLKSIQQQTYSRLEIIVVNDGSQDGTLALCEQAAEEMNRSGEGAPKERSMKIITLGDEGVSVARNRAMDMAQGEYITFVDADDRIVPDMLQTLYDVLCETGSDVAGCRFFIWEKEAEWTAACQKEVPSDGSKAEYETKVYDPEAYCRQEILKGNSRCWSKLYRRDIVAKLRFTEGLSIGEDMLFLLQLQSRLKRIAEIDFAGYGYYQNPDGAMNRKFSKKVMDQITCWEKAREILPDEPQMDSFVLIAVMLAVGRLAQLDAQERKMYREEIGICKRKVKQNLNRRSFGYLDRGYQCKVLLFSMAPALYISLYHVWKK